MEPEPTSSALEQFRQQWQEEVHARAYQKQNKTQSHVRTKSGSEPKARPERPLNKPPTRHSLADQNEDETVVPESSARASSSEKVEGLKLHDADADADEDEFSKLGRFEPKTALEHYERAVEKEGQGNLGDSLSHYRKAFKLDEKVDHTYKEKHFAHKWKRAKSDPPTVATTEPYAIQHAAQQVPNSNEFVPQPTSQLIASFADCEILNAPPTIVGDIPPPCPIRKLPTEVLLELLRNIAISDISIYTRLASVCKKLAYHVYSETSIWKRVALGGEFGLGSQLYHFNTDLQGRPVSWQALEDDDEDERPMPRISDTHLPRVRDYREIFRSYPRIRFTGVYISTVNYTRSGGASVTPAAWGSQVHIVTYYRYLRFFRDGTLVSLLTTHEPLDVVHLLTKENVSQVRASTGKEPLHPLHFVSPGNSLLHDRTQLSMLPPSAQNVVRHALRGRWRLCHPSLKSIEIGSNSGIPGDLHIETEGGAGPRYLYTLHLSLKSGNTRNSSAPMNNKLVWKGFWSYNSVSDDWAEFQLRNDKAFWFSRVKSYGLGY